MQKPIAIFKYSKDNMRNLIVDVMHGGKHFLVGVTLDYKAGGIEVNSVSGLFPKDSHEWIKWIQDGKAIRIDQKKKVLDLIDSLRTNPAESERIGLNLSSAAKIINGFENPVIKDENLSREGEGAYTDDELSLVNVPVAKMFGKSQRTRKQRAAFAARERENMEATVRDLAEKLHLSNVEINTSGEAGNTRMARAKGYFNKKTGKIVINVRNHRDAEDAKKTLLHEGVAHYGLRKFLGDKFDGTLSVIDADDKDAVSYVNAENERRKALARSLGRSYDEVPLIESAFFMDEFWYCRYLGPDGTILWEGESPYPDCSHPFCICATPFIGGKIQSYMRDAIDHNILINRTIIPQDWLIRTIVS